MIKAAIFDMDGLMIDSDRIISRSYEEVLRRHGIEPILNNRGVVHTPGISAVDNWSKLTKTYGLDADISDLAAEKSALHKKYLSEGVELMPGLRGLLELLQEQGIKMAVASSSVREYVENVLAQHDLGRYFETTVAGGEVVNGKPAPDIFLKTASLLGVAPIDCVVFEDAISGVQAAKSAGMKCIAVPVSSEIDAPEFKIADMILDSLEEVQWAALEELFSF